MTPLPDPVIVLPMIEGCRVEGYAIVSTEGMIANAEGVMPDVIRSNADQKFLQSELDRAAVIVHGRHSSEGGPRAAQRKRIILTRQVASLSDDPAHPHSVLWNPAGAIFEAALSRLGVTDGLIAILGGTEVFDLFLPLYDAFHLTRALHAKIPAGRPVFSQVGPRETPEDVLTDAGLKPGHRQDLDAATAITLTTWTRIEGSMPAP
jgi:dihydrofolate reductase